MMKEKWLVEVYNQFEEQLSYEMHVVFISALFPGNAQHMLLLCDLTKLYETWITNISILNTRR